MGSHSVVVDWLEPSFHMLLLNVAIEGAFAPSFYI